SYGGLALVGQDIFASDMRTFGSAADEAQGIIRFDRTSGTWERFAEDIEPTDLTAGQDGKLHALDSLRTVRAYDPNTLALLSTVTLPFSVPVGTGGTSTPQDYRAIAVNAAGEIYTADWGRVVTRFTAAGVVIRT